MQALREAASGILAQIIRDPEPLGERERAFVGLSNVFDSLYGAMCGLGCQEPGVKLQAHAQVRHRCILTDCTYWQY